MQRIIIYLHLHPLVLQSGMLMVKCHVWGQMLPDPQNAELDRLPGTCQCSVLLLQGSDGAAVRDCTQSWFLLLTLLLLHDVMLSQKDVTDKFFAIIYFFQNWVRRSIKLLYLRSNMKPSEVFIFYHHHGVLDYVCLQEIFHLITPL